MTRINTNVSSLNAQKTLERSNADLQTALTRLSTGMRINVGKDDPAGLIASEVLRSDIVSVQRAITNSQRANQMIATADSALGQVSALLNDIRALVSEAANTGAMSAEQIAANQLQVDSSLEAIDRIAQVTQFQGRRLLDGSLDFVTSGLDTTKIADLEIDQANFGAQTEIGVAVDVVKQATQATLTYPFGAISSAVVLEVGGMNGFEAFTFAAGSTIEDMAQAINLVADALGVQAEVQTEATAGAITTSSYGANNDVTITAKQAGESPGNVRVKYTANPAGNPAIGVAYTAANGNDPGIIDVQLQTVSWQAATYTVNGNGDGSSNNAFRITANVAGAEYDGITVNIVDNADAAEVVTYNHGTKTLTIDVDNGGTTTVTDIKALFTADDRLDSLFTLADILGSNASGVILATDTVAQENTGVSGGAIQSTANDVVSIINTTANVQDLVAAALGAGDDGYQLVSAFEEYAYYGQATANTRLQFLAPADTKNMRFASTPDQPLGVDLSTDPQVLGFSSAIVQGLEANTSFRVVARQKGPAYDGIDIDIVDSGLAAGEEVAVWDPEARKLTLNVDITGGATTLDNVLDLINLNDTTSQFFQATSWVPGTGATLITDTDFVGTVATTSGGVTSEGTIIINLETDEDGVIQTSAAELITFLDNPANVATLGPLGISASHAQGSSGAGILAATTTDIVFATSGADPQPANAAVTINAANGLDAMLTVTAKLAGTDYDGVSVEFEDTALSGAETVTYDAATKTLLASIEDGVTTAATIVDIINGVTPGASTAVISLFTAALPTDVYGIAANDSTGADPLTRSDGGVLSGGSIDQGSQDGAALLGNADQANTGLQFKAVEYGEDAFVSVRPLNAATFDVLDTQGLATNRTVGTDIDARINGVQAVGRGLTASLNTSALDLSFSLDESVKDGDSFSFRIVDGGAQFQLGPDVVSNQQARLGISSVNTAKLGGISGRLYQLRSGSDFALDTDVYGAASVVEEVISQITVLRGRLGAFQRTTLETNINALNDTLESLTAAESSIRDADFAAETANLTRAQILVQSGLSVLSIANKNPQNVLMLLQ